MICVGGGEGIDLGSGVVVSVFPSLQSCLWTGTHAAGAGETCLGDLGVTWQERSSRMKELTNRLSTSLNKVAIEDLIAAVAGHSDRDDGGGSGLLYRDARRFVALPGHVSALEWRPGFN